MGPPLSPGCLHKLIIKKKNISHCCLMITLNANLDMYQNYSPDQSHKAET